jgi:hypothetical protein
MNTGRNVLTLAVTCATPQGMALFETVVNIVHKSAPNAAIAVNTRSEDTADAAARQLGAD